MTSISFTEGQRIQLPGRETSGWFTIDFARPVADGWQLYVKDTAGAFHKLDLTEDQAQQATILIHDGAAEAKRVLAGLWTRWMDAASASAHATLLASSPLRPFPHQANAVYGAMLPQPQLRFLLADEPGTGKTIMAGLYLREMQKLGLIRRALIVAPAGLVSKWQADFDRFFGGGLRRITNETVQQHGLAAPHDMWVVSLELAAINPAVQEAIRPDRAGWDAVVFDEAHRLTPTAETFHRAGSLLAKNTVRALFMTATPHRGSEWLFRHLLHLVDPEVYPEPDSDKDAPLRPIKPGPVHFLRRMKEDLVDYDGATPLFKGRRAQNVMIPLNGIEDAFYREALALVDAYFPTAAAPLARMVYGKRAASTLYALAETLKRRHDGMGSQSPAEAARVADPNDEDAWEANEARVVAEASKATAAERRAIAELLNRLNPLLETDQLAVSKWRPLVDECLAANGIRPGNGLQAVVFTEYADSANWIVDRLHRDGFTARRYSGQDKSAIRDQIRAAFANRQFQVIVSTDAGNEGIDLQTAHVLVNYDIPWSLVRLEQRMGRIHRVGQDRDVELYNLIAQGTREGDVLKVLLENFVAAANQLGGQLFDSLSVAAELVNLDVENTLADTYLSEDKRLAALAAVSAVSHAQLRSAAEKARRTEAELASTVDVAAAATLLNADLLERINPAIVEAYLERLHAAGVIGVTPTASGEGILRLAAATGMMLPAGLGENTHLRVATSGRALSDARATGASLTDVVSLGPGEPAFRSLVEYATETLSPDVFRGGLVADPTSIDNYDLFAFEADLSEAGGKRTSRWAVLIRVDDVGARPVRWETLANLIPGSGIAGPAHPGRALDARSRADQIAAEERVRREQAMRTWLAKAETELRRLPRELCRDIENRDDRRAQRERLEAHVAQRLADLRRLTKVQIANVRQVAYVKVAAAGIPPEPTELDSERIAMKGVRDRLAADGWQVADVSTERRGYDLYATRGAAYRCVEVKGIWGSAATTGIRLTGNEVLVATQQRADYWLYVVDGCGDGKGQLFGMYRDPVSTFEGLITQAAVFKVPGSALTKARGEVVAV